VSASLLDVNVLLASVDRDHVAYRKIHSWLDQHGTKAWATCPLTQAGFVRILSNRGFHAHPVNVDEACDLLSALTSRPDHHFWSMDMTLGEAVRPFRERLFGHRQITDAYLLGLAIKNKGQLVTLDGGIEALAGSEWRRYVSVLR